MGVVVPEDFGFVSPGVVDGTVLELELPPVVSASVVRTRAVSRVNVLSPSAPSTKIFDAAFARSLGFFGRSSGPVVRGA